MAGASYVAALNHQQRCRACCLASTPTKLSCKSLFVLLIALVLSTHLLYVLSRAYFSSTTWSILHSASSQQSSSSSATAALWSSIYANSEQQQHGKNKNRVRLSNKQPTKRHLPSVPTHNTSTSSLIPYTDAEDFSSESYSLYARPYPLHKNAVVSTNNTYHGVLSSLEREYFPVNHFFNVSGEDVLVFLHIQKTGGTTLGRLLVRNLDIYVNDDPQQLVTNKPCVCSQGVRRCRCDRPSLPITDAETRMQLFATPERQWLFSRYSTGWRCGLHADWTELTNCVDSYLDRTEKPPPASSLSHPRSSSAAHWPPKRRYFYLTILRNPMQRYVSEFLHIQRGATWDTSRFWCGGREALHDELPKCSYQDLQAKAAVDETRNVTLITLEQFMSCPNNFANNRQTRMLADLELINCYSNNSAIFNTQAERDIVLLASAKANLRRIAFFAILERLHEAQVMFEGTFRNIKFRAPLATELDLQHTEQFMLSESQQDEVRKLNHLDEQLYAYAQDLFSRRLNVVRRYQVRHSPSTQQQQQEISLSIEKEITVQQKENATNFVADIDDNSVRG